MTAARQLAALTDLDPSLSWRAWTEADLPVISRLLTLVEQADDVHERHSQTELAEFLGWSGVTPGLDTLAAFAPDGSILAVGRVQLSSGVGPRRGSWLAGAVAPAARNRGLGRALLAWEIARIHDKDAQTRLPEHGPLRLRIYSGQFAHSEHRLAARFGFGPLRYFSELQQSLPADPIGLPQVPGVSIVAWTPALHETVRQVRNAAFEDHWGSTPMSPTEWADALSASAIRLSWSFVAVAADGSVVGYLLSAAYEQDWATEGRRSGYLESLGTLREWRGRGVATALIRRGMLAFQRDGMAAAGIGVDTANPSGAAGLYAALGFRPTSMTVLWARDE